MNKNLYHIAYDCIVMNGYKNECKTDILYPSLIRLFPEDSIFHKISVK